MELVALVPVLAAVLALGMLVAVLAGQWVAAAGAARVGARADEVGGDGRAAARSALPAEIRRRARVSSDGARVSVWVPGVDLGPLGRIEGPRATAHRP